MSEDYNTLYHIKEDKVVMDGFIETLLDEVGDAVYYQDSDLLYRFFNEDYLTLVNKTAEEVKGHNIFNVFPKELADVYHKDDLEVLKIGKRKSYVAEIISHKGDKRLIEVIKRPHVIDGNKVIGIFGIIRDITEIREKQKRLDMLDQVKSVFLDINKKVLKHKTEHDFFDAIQMEIQSVFEQCRQSSVLKIEDNREISILVHRGYIDEEASGFRMPFKDSYLYRHKNGNFEEAFYVNDVQFYLSDKSVPIITSEENHQIRSTLCIPLTDDKVLKYLISIDSNIEGAFNETDRLVAEFISKELPIIYNIFKLHSETVKLSKYDELTGLYNRRYFNQVAIRFLADVPETTPISFVIADIDNLKRVNDRYGHLAGDMYITVLSDAFKSIQSQQVKFGRIGGDEFIGIFVDTPYDQVEEIMLELQSSFSKQMIQSGEHYFLGGFSYGLAFKGLDGEKRQPLMKVADLRMYKNKHR